MADSWDARMPNFAGSNDSLMQPGAAGFLLKVAAFLLIYSFVIPKSEAIASEGELLPVAGTIEQVFASPGVPSSGCTRYSCKVKGEPAHLNVHVQVEGRGHEHFVQDPGITDVAPGLIQLQGGDSVTMLVQSRAETKLDDGIDGNLWKLERGGATILSYEQTREYIGHTYWNMPFWCRVAAFLLAAIGAAIFILSPVENLDDMQ